MTLYWKNLPNSLFEWFLAQPGAVKQALERAQGDSRRFAADPTQAARSRERIITVAHEHGYSGPASLAEERELQRRHTRPHQSMRRHDGLIDDDRRQAISTSPGETEINPRYALTTRGN